jgi:hypothetical protein
MLFSQRQVEFAKLYSSKLFILGGLRRLANNPRALYGRSKTLFFDANLKGTDETQTLAVYEQALTFLSQMGPSSAIAFDQWLPVLNNGDIDHLGKLFVQHGSDKSTSHDYHLVYGSVLSPKRDGAFNILEIGLGTNNIDVLQSSANAPCPAKITRNNGIPAGAAS